MNYCKFLPPLLLMSSFAYSAEETVAPKPFRLKDLEPGEVKYIPLRQLPDDLRQKVEDQNRLLEKRTTKSGIKYDLFDVGEVAIEMPANERLRLAGKKAGAKIQDLSTTKFAALQEEGVSTEEANHVSRVFMDGNDIVLLREWDYLAARGSIFKVEENQNTKVNSTPAVFVALRSPNGILYQLAWTTPARDYNLYLRTIKEPDDAYARMLELASSIKD
jgi:hypothetical protein